MFTKATFSLAYEKIAFKRTRSSSFDIVVFLLNAQVEMQNRKLDAIDLVVFCDEHNPQFS